MFYDHNEDPASIFNYIKMGEFEVVWDLVEKNKIDVNFCDSVGNDVVTRLLKAKQYELVLTLMKKKNWDVNHQNEDGDTFGHILAMDNSASAIAIIAQLMKKKNYLPNIKNKKGETMFDKAINNNYIGAAIKILGDKRFNDIDIKVFKKLCRACLYNKYYGKYSKLNNLEIIVESLGKKELIPDMKDLVEKINTHWDQIKDEIMSDDNNTLSVIINSYNGEATN